MEFPGDPSTTPIAEGVATEERALRKNTDGSQVDLTAQCLQFPLFKSMKKNGGKEEDSSDTSKKKGEIIKKSSPTLPSSTTGDPPVASSPIVFQNNHLFGIYKSNKKEEKEQKGLTKDE